MGKGRNRFRSEFKILIMFGKPIVFLSQVFAQYAPKSHLKAFGSVRFILDDFAKFFVIQLNFMSAKFMLGEVGDPDSHRSSTQLNDSGLKTVRIFMRKPLDAQPQRSRSRGRKGRPTHPNNEFAGFYSPTHSQQLQKSRVDLNKVLSRTPISSPQQLPPSTPSKSVHQTQPTINPTILTTPPCPSRLNTNTDETNYQTQASDITRYSSQKFEAAAIELMQGRIQTLEACMSSLTVENKRLREELEKVINMNDLACNEAEDNGRKCLEMEGRVRERDERLEDILKDNEELRRRVDELKVQNETLVSTNNSRLQITNYLQSSVQFLKQKLQGQSRRRQQLQCLIKGLQQTIRLLQATNKSTSLQLQSRQKSIDQLSSLLSVQQSKSNTLLAARDTVYQELLAERQKNKYLGVELSVLKHKKHAHDSSNQKEKGRLIQHNKKLRVETMKLRLTQRQQRNQLFELSP